MTPRAVDRLVVTVIVLAAACLSERVDASLYWNAGVRSSTVTVCFVGDTLTARPQRVQQILTYIKEFSYPAKIDFSFLGTCPGSKPQPSGNDWFDGDIRVVIPNTSVSGEGKVPGQGCYLTDDEYKPGDNVGWGSWSHSPQDLEPRRGCLYNLKLGDDGWNSVPYLNHTLHEFGHALGLAHEHQRTDVDRTICSANGFGGGVGSGFLTVYDRHSVMHYMLATCGINGNYDNTGLSSLDQLGIHILYPKTSPVAEFAGTTVLRPSDQLRLKSAWAVRGTALSFVGKNNQWRISGMLVGNQPDLSMALSEGEHHLEYTHADFLGRNYHYHGKVRVLSPDRYTRSIAGPLFSTSILFMMAP